MKIGRYDIGENNLVFITAEIGINHNGSVEIAKQLIDAAKLAGCDAVKFQKRTIEAVYSKEELQKPRESPWGTTTEAQKRGLEFGYEQYAEIDRYCRERGILWYASPWDRDSVLFLEQFNIPCYKVASACITDVELLSAIHKTGKPVILSTGMSTRDQVDRAVSILAETYSDDRPLALLATTSTYPCKLEDLNLLKIVTLQGLYPNAVVGYSNHSPGIWPMLSAVALGAKMIEMHITLDRSSYGSDQSSSIEPHGLMKIVKEIRDFEKAKGHGRLEILNSEIPILEKLRKFK